MVSLISFSDAVPDVQKEEVLLETQCLLVMRRKKEQVRRLIFGASNVMSCTKDHAHRSSVKLFQCMIFGA